MTDELQKHCLKGMYLKAHLCHDLKRNRTKQEYIIGENNCICFTAQSYLTKVTDFNISPFIPDQ